MAGKLTQIILQTTPTPVNIVNVIVYYFEKFKIIPLDQDATVEENIKIALNSLQDVMSTIPITGNRVTYK